MKSLKYVWPGVAALVIACSSSHDDGNKTGQLALSLTATDDAGEVYRLRNASFNIYGYPQYSYPSSAGGEGGTGSESYYYSETVTTESAPNAMEIVRRVVPGTYYITFDTSQPWYIDHLTSQGAVRVQRSVLLSQPQQYAYVYDRSTASVFYEFGVDGRTIDFRHGDIHIGIGVEHPDPGDGQGGFGGSF